MAYLVSFLVGVVSLVFVMLFSTPYSLAQSIGSNDNVVDIEQVKINNKTYPSVMYDSVLQVYKSEVDSPLPNLLEFTSRTSPIESLTSVRMTCVNNITLVFGIFPKNNGYYCKFDGTPKNATIFFRDTSKILGVI